MLTQYRISHITKQLQASFSGLVIHYRRREGILILHSPAITSKHNL